MSGLRALPCALALLLASCAGATGPNDGDARGPEAPGSPEVQRSDGAGTREPGTAKRGEPPPSASPGKTAGGVAPGSSRLSYADDGRVGDMARVYLRSRPARRLFVEIDFVRGREPQRAAVDHLRRVLERELSKPGGITLRVDDALPGGDDAYSFEEIEALERRWRDRRSDGSTATLWIGYLDGSLAQDSSALGVAYQASSAVLFADRIVEARTPLVGSAAIERSVLIHEIGHLLALVNIGYTSERDHEDPEHPKHSRNRSSVMYWAIEDVSIASILRGGPPDDFDEDDRADLAMLRGGPALSARRKPGTSIL